MTASTLPALLYSLLDSDPARPLVTFYDDATGERIELSVKSFENWVAKTANLLQDEVSVEPGDHVALWLPAHWQSAVCVFAAAACGAVVSHDRTTQAEAEVVFCDPESLSAARDSGAPEVVALSLRPMGQGFTEPLPAGVTDYARTVLAQGDTFLPIGATDPDAPFLFGEGASRSQSDLLEEARKRAAELSLQPTGRLLTDADPADPRGLVAILAALVSNGSVVLNRNPDPTVLDGRATQEQVTTQWWAGG